MLAPSVEDSSSPAALEALRGLVDAGARPRKAASIVGLADRRERERAVPGAHRGPHSVTRPRRTRTEARNPPPCSARRPTVARHGSSPLRDRSRHRGAARGRAARGGAPGWVWPVRGEVITPYRNGDDPYAGGQHREVDIAAPVGAAVVAARSGVVRFAGAAGHSGLTLGIRTADGRYDSLPAPLHRVGAPRQRVAAGQRLGSAGTSGRPSSPRPHLHFGVRDAGSRHAYQRPAPLPTPARPRPPLTGHRFPSVRRGRRRLRTRSPHHGPRHEPRRGGRREARRAVRRGPVPVPGPRPAPRVHGRRREPLWRLRHGAASRLASRRPARPTLQRGRAPRRRLRRRNGSRPGGRRRRDPTSAWFWPASASCSRRP